MEARDIDGLAHDVDPGRVRPVADRRRGAFWARHLESVDTRKDEALQPFLRRRAAHPRIERGQHAEGGPDPYRPRREPAREERRIGIEAYEQVGSPPAGDQVGRKTVVVVR